MDWLLVILSSPFVWLGIGALVLIYVLEQIDKAKSNKKKQLELESRIKELEKKLIPEE